MYSEKMAAQERSNASLGAAAASYGGLVSTSIGDKHESEIAYAARQLESAIDRIGHRADALNLALGPILSKLPTNGINKATAPQRPTSSTMGAGLIEAASKIDNVSDRLETILNSLAL